MIQVFCVSPNRGMDPTGFEPAISVLTGMLASFLICRNFRQMAMHSENMPIIIHDPMDK